ncbi:MAG: cytochrome c biogenesis protein ResB [Pseudobdellovibrionaceae bacterium]
MIRKIIHYLASIKSAVVVIILIAVLTAVGTFVEARYDAYAAKKWVYSTPWMFAILGLLAINLTAVILDRWPWKKRHVAFISAHVGILMLLAGSVQTLFFGLDGSMRIENQQSSQMVTLPETDVVVWSSFDGDRYSKTFEKEVDFFLHPPSADKPFALPVYEDSMKLIDYKKYVIPQRQVTPSEEPRAGVGLRFQLLNDRVNLVEWLVQRNPRDVVAQNLGPAQIHLMARPEALREEALAAPHSSNQQPAWMAKVAPKEGRGKNEVFLTPYQDGVKYVVFHRQDKKPYKQGFIKEGEQFESGWMGIQFKLLRFMPKAQESWDIVERDRPTPMTTSAAKISFKGREQWLLLNDVVKLFTDNAVYLVSFRNRQVDVGFPVKLVKFNMDKYQGTARPMSYESLVEVPELGQHLISMNEPLKWKNLTFYQASFQEDPNSGEVVATILSVNHDPGRFLKYLGSLVMTIGIILLFYFKRLDFIKQRKAQI